MIFEKVDRLLANEERRLTGKKSPWLDRKLTGWARQFSCRLDRMGRSDLDRDCYREYIIFVTARLVSKPTNLMMLFRSLTVPLMIR